VSSIFSLLMMDRHRELQSCCSFVASDKKVKYYPHQMRNYGHFRSLVARVSREITQQIYPQHRGGPAATYRTLNIERRDQYRDLR
jgi:hypothetical protein